MLKKYNFHASSHETVKKYAAHKYVHRHEYPFGLDYERITCEKIK